MRFIASILWERPLRSHGGEDFKSLPQAGVGNSGPVRILVAGVKSTGRLLILRMFVGVFNPYIEIQKPANVGFCISIINRTQFALK